MIDPGDFLRAAPWLQAGAVARLLDLLDGDGEEARVVGGAVRNTLLGAPPGDVDIATTALPPEVIRRTERAGLKAAPTGIEHGTITVIADGQPIEVTTLRQDVETFGRKASVRFGRDWKTDAERRDFTMNALAVTREGKVIDLVGGLADLAARRVRFIGDPEARIREDFLRILRFFRFHAAYGSGAPDAAGLQASIRLRAGLDALSRERVRMELLKLFVAPGAAATLVVIADSGLIEPILGVPLVPQFARLAAAEATLNLSPDPIRRLGALAVHVSDDADRLSERLRLSNDEHARLCSMAERWWRLAGDLSDQTGRALLYRLGPERFRDRVLYAWSRNAANDPAWRNFASLPDRWRAPPFPLRAAAFIGLEVPIGPALGAALADAEEAWIAADFPSEPEVLGSLAERIAARHRT